MKQTTLLNFCPWVLAFALFSGCASTPSETVYGGTTKQVNIDQRLLEPPKPFRKVIGTKDIVKQQADNAKAMADCSLRFNQLIDVVKDAFNLKGDVQ